MRAYFPPQGQSKLSVIMRCRIKRVSVKRALTVYIESYRNYAYKYLVACSFLFPSYFSTVLLGSFFSSECFCYLCSTVNEASIKLRVRRSSYQQRNQED